jgi:topoisomerase-4 subunit A
VAFLNLDRVIRIIRTEDSPRRDDRGFKLTDRQGEAILNMAAQPCAG